MDDSKNNIPTLTDISHQGNAEMLNHFDAHQFNAETEETENIITLENASEFENETSLLSSEALDADNLNEIPSIKIEEFVNNDIETENFSEAMHSIVNKTIEEKLANNNLKEKIDTAIENALSGMEQQLKEQLYKEFNI